MSEPEIDPKQPVSFAALEAVLQNMQNTFNDALKKRDEQSEARFNQFAQVLQQVVDRVQATPEKGGIAAGIDKTTLIGQAVDKLADKLLNNEQQTELDQISNLLARSMMREVVLAGKSRARAALKRGLLFPEETEGLLDDRVEKAVTKHGPGV